MYIFSLIAPTDNDKGKINVRFEYVNANNWYIVHTHCIIKLSGSNEGYTRTASIESNYNDGSIEKFAKDVKTENENPITLYWGLGVQN